MRRDEPGRVVGAEEVPRIKSAEVLKGAEELVAADCGNELVSIGSTGGVLRSCERVRDLPVVATKRR